MTDRFDDVREALAKVTPGNWSAKELAKTLEAGVRSRPELAKFHESTDYQADAAGIVTLKNRTPAMLAELDALAARVAALEAENGRLKGTVIAFAGPWSAEYARMIGLPKGHLHPTHYDILAECGARMVEFTRAAMEASHEGR